MSVYMQMRAQVEYAGTNKSRTGNWSMSKTLPILIVPPPARIHAISAHLLGGVFFNYQKHLLSVLVMWVPSNLRTIRQSLQRKVKVTGYRVAVGLAPIEGPFGEVPLDTKVSNFRVSACVLGFMQFSDKIMSEKCSYVLLYRHFHVCNQVSLH